MLIRREQLLLSVLMKSSDLLIHSVTGGSVVKYLCEGLPTVDTDWSKWVLAFCDERVVPEDSDDSTFGTYKRQLIPKTQLKESQFVVIKQGVSGRFNFILVI